MEGRLRQLVPKLFVHTTLQQRNLVDCATYLSHILTITQVQNLSREGATFLLFSLFEQHKKKKSQSLSSLSSISHEVVKSNGTLGSSHSYEKMDLTPGYSFELLPIKTLTSIEGLRQKIKEPITCHDKRLLVNLLYGITTTMHDTSFLSSNIFRESFIERHRRMGF